MNWRREFPIVIKVFHGISNINMSYNIGNYITFVMFIWQVECMNNTCVWPIVFSNSTILNKFAKEFGVWKPSRARLLYENRVVVSRGAVSCPCNPQTCGNKVKVAMIDYLRFHRKSSIVGNMSSYTWSF